jgi:pimeloyl-ACP methyl ester carboxylesterase
MVLIQRSLALVFVLACLAPLGCRPPAPRMQTSTFDANGVPIAYFVQGEGEPVVLIHGWLSSAGVNWSLPGTSDLLAREYKVIALDVRGHGLSGKPTGEEAYGPELVEDVVRLLDHLGIEKAHVVGYSMGGIIAANFMAKHPDRVLSGALCGMGWLQHGGVGQLGFAQIGKNDPNAEAKTVCGRSLANLALTTEQFDSIRVPVTVIVGDKDTLIRKLYVEPLQQRRRDWPVVDVKDADHLSCVVKPQFRQEILTWLRQQSAQGR